MAAVFLGASLHSYFGEHLALLVPLAASRSMASLVSGCPFREGQQSARRYGRGLTVPSILTGALRIGCSRQVQQGLTHFANLAGPHLLDNTDGIHLLPKRRPGWLRLRISQKSSVFADNYYQFCMEGFRIDYQAFAVFREVDQWQCRTALY
jgi:hypothetical protein